MRSAGPPGHSRAALINGLDLSRAEAIGPGGLHEDAPDVAVAGAPDAVELASFAA